MAEIKVSKAQLDAVSEERRQDVISALHEAEILKPGDVLVGDEGVAPVSQERKAKDWGDDVPNDVIDACWDGAKLAFAGCAAAGGHEWQCLQLLEKVFHSCIAAWE
jgi:hypothetical protein